MSDWRNLAAILELDVPHWKAHAMDYMERAGFRFCVDFGTENVVEKARAHWRNRRRKRRR